MKDILLDNNYDMQITNGDLLISESAHQDVELLLITSKGEWKQWPLTGVGILDYHHAPQNIPALKREIQIQLTDNKIPFKSILIHNSKIQIE